MTPIIIETEFGVQNSNTDTWSSPLTNGDRSDQVHASMPDLVCFSHLRWNFVYQRPQHLLSRAAMDRRVFVIEEPIYDNGSVRIEVSQSEDGVWNVVPHLPEGLRSEVATGAVLRELVDRLFSDYSIREYVLWYYTPLALSFTSHLRPIATVYDCMDELSAFKGAPASLRDREKQLFKCADLVFTGGQTLYEAKRDQHQSVFAFPSSIDREHFAKARNETVEPEDQKQIPHPRLGFFGVIDERLDIDLLDKAAGKRPDWQFVMIGPVVKIDPETLPRRTNIHYLGSKSYKELPSYISGWDVALLLFARNEATKFISPTKTPEYLAAGKPVVSTSITDVVRPYGEQKLVRIADDANEFVRAVEESLQQGESERTEWLRRVDSFLSTMSWDDTWSRMREMIENATAKNRAKANAPAHVAVRTRAAGLVGAS